MKALNPNNILYSLGEVKSENVKYIRQTEEWLLGVKSLDVDHLIDLSLIQDLNQIIILKRRRLVLSSCEYELNSR